MSRPSTYDDLAIHEREPVELCSINVEEAAKVCPALLSGVIAGMDSAISESNEPRFAPNGDVITPVNPLRYEYTGGLLTVIRERSPAELDAVLDRKKVAWDRARTYYRSWATSGTLPPKHAWPEVRSWCRSEQPQGGPIPELEEFVGGTAPGVCAKG